MGHGNLVNQLLGVQLAKGETLTEWRDRPLTQQQIRYAFDDVRYLLPLWRRLAKRLESSGRGDWAREEFVRLAEHAAPAEPAMDKWRKLRGLGALDRRRLAVVRELYRWRTELAARSDRPPRVLVRDDLLIECARRNTGRGRGLHVIRGSPRLHLPAIMEVVNRARALPIAECPTLPDRDQDPPQVALIGNILGAVLGDFCTRNQLAANLVASGHEMK